MVVGELRSDIFLYAGGNITYFSYSQWGAYPAAGELAGVTYFDHIIANSKLFAFDTAVYISPVRSTGIDSPFYGIFEANHTDYGQTASFYVRSGRTAAACEADTWHAATAGTYVTGLGNYKYVQYKINLATGDIIVSPVVNSVKINWGTNSAINEASMQGIWWGDYYLLGYAEGGEKQNNAVLAYNYKNGQWTKFSGWHVNRWCRFLDTLYFADSRSGKIYRAWVGNNDAGETITAYVKLKANNFGAPYAKKNMRFLYVTTLTSPDTSDLYVYYTADDKALTGFDTIPLYDAYGRTRRISRLEINKDFYFFEVEFYHDALDQTFKIYDYQFGITAGKPLKDEW